MLNHTGFRFPDEQTVVVVQRRLGMAGIATQREEGVECCHYIERCDTVVGDANSRGWAGELVDRAVGLERIVFVFRTEVRSR